MREYLFGSGFLRGKVTVHIEENTEHFEILVRGECVDWAHAFVSVKKEDTRGGVTGKGWRVACIVCFLWVWEKFCEMRKLIDDAGASLKTF